MITANEAKELVAKSDKNVEYYLIQLDKKITECATKGERKLSTDCICGLYYDKQLADFSQKSFEHRMIDNTLRLLKPKLEALGFGATIKCDTKQYQVGGGLGSIDDGYNEPVKSYYLNYMLITW